MSEKGRNELVISGVTYLVYDITNSIVVNECRTRKDALALIEKYKEQDKRFHEKNKYEIRMRAES
jgi:uncharacterized phage-like protein YoqJ